MGSLGSWPCWHHRPHHCPVSVGHLPFRGSCSFVYLQDLVHTLPLSSWLLTLLWTQDSRVLASLRVLAEGKEEERWDSALVCIPLGGQGRCFHACVLVRVKLSAQLSYFKEDGGLTARPCAAVLWIPL